MTKANYKDWTAAIESREEILAPEPVNRMLAMLDSRQQAFHAGDALPPLWHWLYFLPAAMQSEIGEDGHPQLGGFLPPVDLPQRMFAGSKLLVHEPLIIGQTAVREAEVIDVTEKTGSTGQLVFVSLRYRVYQQSRLCVEEEQRVVYRNASEVTAAPALGEFEPAPAGATTRIIMPDPVLLFRFSALTFNAHRIHYDRPYATDVAGYPGLIVHAPLTAVLLAELIRANMQRQLKALEFRALAPLFDTGPVQLVAIPDGTSTLRLEARRHDLTLAMQGTAQLIR